MKLLCLKMINIQNKKAIQFSLRCCCLRKGDKLEALGFAHPLQQFPTFLVSCFVHMLGIISKEGGIYYIKGEGGSWLKKKK